MGRLEAEAAIEVGLLAEGFRITCRVPYPPMEMRNGEAALGTLWRVGRPTDGAATQLMWTVTDEELEHGDPADLARHLVAITKANYAARLQGVPA